MFLGRIIGGYMKKKVLSEKRMIKNSPTDPYYIINDRREFEKEKNKSIELVQTFYKNGPSKCTTVPHSFFGNLTPEEWAILHWKHFDHHLRQFNS